MERRTKLDLKNLSFRYKQIVWIRFRLVSKQAKPVKEALNHFVFS